MGGGTLQLVAYGGQDIHIIGNPELSFFKSVYRRHTNFAMECIKQNMLGSVSTEAFKASFKLGREGDLINKMHLQIKLPEQKDLLLTAAPTDGAVIEFTLGENILSHIEITNNGQGYIFGATVSVISDDVQNLGTFYADIDSDNKIKKIVVEDRIAGSFQENTQVTVTITGNPDPTLKTGDPIYDNNLPKYGSGATAIAVRSSRGIVSVLTDLESENNGGKLFRNPYISLGVSSVTIAPIFEITTSNQDGRVIKVKILKSGSFDNGEDVTGNINEGYNGGKPSILTDLSSDHNDLNPIEISKRKDAWISYQDQPSYCYIKDIELKIGEQLIDRHTGQYYDIYDEFYSSDDNHINNINYITGKSDQSNEWPPNDKFPNTNGKTLVPKEIDLYIPLKFWFTKDTGQSLPMIALQYHDVTIDINFRSLKSIMIWNAGKLVVSKTREDGTTNETTRHLDFSDFEINRINQRSLIKPEIELWANYIYLDTDERKRFAKNGHEYLIEQVQIIKDKYKKVVDIPFNHSVKTLFWAIQGKECSKENNQFKNNRHEISNDTISNDWQNRKLYKPPNPTGSDIEEVSYRNHAKPYDIVDNVITDITDERWITRENSQEDTGDAYSADYTLEKNYKNGFTQNNNYLFYGIHEENVNKSYLNYIEQSENFDMCKIIMNGIDRIPFKKSTYFRTIQPYESNMRIPFKPIYMYSFSLDPKKHQPTGTCNFSKLDSAKLVFEGDNNFSNYDIYVYAQNYNILRIMEGMGGLLYNS